MKTPLQTDNPKSFNLIRWFSLLSLLTIGLISIVTSLLLSRFLTDRILERDGVMTTEFIQAVVRLEGAERLFRDPQVDRTDPDLLEFFEYVGTMHDSLRANIYGTDSRIIWSTEKNLIGKKFDSNEDLDVALRGELKIESGVVGRERHPKPEHVDLGAPGEHFVENYIPIRDYQTKELIGVVEMYRIPRALFATIAEGTRLIWLSGLLAGTLLYASLFWLVIRADRTIRAQQGQLVESKTLAVVGEMAGAIAHGLRNPLASIRSSAELSLDGFPSQGPESSQDIIAEVDRIENMVRQLLAYSQAPSIELARTDIGQALQESLSNFARSLEKRNVVTQYKLAPNLPPVRADVALLSQVFNSLFANAMEAMPEGGKLTVAAAPGSDKKTVELTIKDTGVGISPNQLEWIFLPFHTTKRIGLGIGLPLVHRIVRRFGGEITVASEPGKGTIVRLSLRIAN
jgi:two-component system sensor histidine kinase HydH